MVKQVTKPWYESRTVWAAAASLVVAVSSALYGDTSTATAVFVAVFSALGIHGRIRAQGPLR